MADSKMDVEKSDEDMEGSDEDQWYPLISFMTHPNGNVEEPVFQYNDPLLVTGVLRAVVEDDFDKVKRLIESGKSCNINDNNGNTPLHVAVLKNNQVIIEFLLAQYDIVINTRNFHGATPLLLAVKNCLFKSAEILIDAGADVNIPNYQLVTPLHVCVAHPEIAQLLIMHGADVDALDYSHDTPLHDAISEGCVETVCMLLYYKADANVYGGTNLTPFMKALITQNEEIQAALFEYVPDFNASIIETVNVLTLAVAHDSPYVKEIIERGAVVDPSAYFACFARSIHDDSFKLVWNQLESMESTDLKVAQLLSEVTTSEFENYIDVILESSYVLNIRPLVDSLIESKNYFRLIGKFQKSNFGLDRLTKLTCLLIQYGYVINTREITEIFTNFGYCELFKILLYIENKNDWGPFVITPRLIFDIKSNLKLISGNFIKWPANSRSFRKDLKAVLELWASPHLVDLYSNRFNKHDKSLMLQYAPKVPSLLQLARDKTKETLIQKFKVTSTCDYYTLVDFLNISNVYKRILKYETKLYPIFRHDKNVPKNTL